MSETSDVVVTRSSGIVRITLSRPERRNAITVPMMRVIRRAIDGAGDDPSTRVIVISAEGDRAFCAGADLNTSDTPFQPNFSETTLPFADLLRSGYSSKVPILCAINGACVAGGMGFLGICDIAIASRSAKFGMPEAKVGIFPMQIIAVLRGLVPARALSDMCLTGRLISADEALEMGLLNRVVEPEMLESAVDEYLQEILAVSPTAVRRGKYALRAMADMSFEQMIAFAETQVTPMILTEDAREGMKAFAEKRPPIWTNR